MRSTRTGLTGSRPDHVAENELVPALDRYDNDQVRFHGANLHGEMHGAWEFFRRDGSLMRAGEFVRGRQIGVWRTFDRAGSVVKETDFGQP